MGLPKNIQLLDTDKLEQDDLQPAIALNERNGMPVYDENGKHLGSFCIVLRKPKKDKGKE